MQQYYKIFANIGVRGTAAALAFVAQIALVKLLGQDIYGAYVIFVTQCSLVLIFAKFGLDVSVVRRVAVDHETGNLRDARALVVKASLFCLASAPACAAVFWCMSALLRPADTQTNTFHYFLWLSAGVGSMAVLMVNIAAIRGIKNVIWADAIDSVIKPIVSVCVVAFLAFVIVEKNNFIAYLSLILSNLLALIGAIFLYLRRTEQKKPLQLNTQKMKVVDWRESVYLVFYGCLTFAFFQFDTLLVGHFLNDRAVAAYNMACNFVRLVIFIPMIAVARLQPVLAPLYHRGDYVESSRHIRGSLKLGLAAAIVATLFLGIAGRRFLAYVHPDFESANEALKILCAAHIVNSAILILGGAMMMAKRHKEVVWSQMAGAALCIPLYYFLIPRFGINGSAAAVFAGLLLDLLILIYFFIKFNKKS